MRKISAMYAWSGGTEYRHVCKECRNCVRAGKRDTYKCLSYGTDGNATDWNPASIACKAFDQAPPEIPIFFTDAKKQSEGLENQMTIFDFIE